MSVYDDDDGDENMATPNTWLELLAWTKTISDTVSGAADIYEIYRK